MEYRYVEAGNGFNWAKFIVARFDKDDWDYQIRHPDAGTGSLVRSQGWGPNHVLVVDLATGEGAMFTLGGLASADLTKHRIWVCLLFEPFLHWLHRLYRYWPDEWFERLPEVVTLPDSPRGFHGYRRTGPVPPPEHPVIAAWLRRSVSGRRMLPPQRWYRAQLEARRLLERRRRPSPSRAARPTS